MERSTQSQLEQAIRNREEQVLLRDKEITKLRAQLASLDAQDNLNHSLLEKERAQNAAFLVAQKSFAASLAERIAELEAQREKAPATLRLEINGQIGLIQAIAHDYNQSMIALNSQTTNDAQKQK
jgi:chromosome segregation ATPase